MRIKTLAIVAVLGVFGAPGLANATPAASTGALSGIPQHPILLPVQWGPWPGAPGGPNVCPSPAGPVPCPGPGGPNVCPSPAGPVPCPGPGGPNMCPSPWGPVPCPGQPGFPGP